MDVIGDFLSQIRNAYMAGKLEIVAPHSKQKQVLAELLVKTGYLAQVKVDNPKAKKKKLLVKLNYIDGKKAVLSKIERVSKPGRRFYASANNVPWTLGGFGLTIVSTPKGIMTHKEAKKNNLGGEIICKIFP